jgi:hypothetical protein
MEFYQVTLDHDYVAQPLKWYSTCCSHLTSYKFMHYIHILSPNGLLTSLVFGREQQHLISFLLRETMPRAHKPLILNHIKHLGLSSYMDRKTTFMSMSCRIFLLLLESQMAFQQPGLKSSSQSCTNDENCNVP